MIQQPAIENVRGLKRKFKEKFMAMSVDELIFESAAAESKLEMLHLSLGKTKEEINKIIKEELHKIITAL